MSFRLAPHVSVDAVRDAVGVDLRLDGNRAEFSSADPQRDLYLLLGWADDQQIALDDLTVQRSSLEDLFLSIRGDDHATDAVSHGVPR